MLEVVTLPLGSYQTNCYLIWRPGETACAVIDPGGDPERLLQKVRDLGLSVEAILLTHGHFDHVAPWTPSPRRQAVPSGSIQRT